MSTYDDSSLFLYPSGYKASVLFAQKPMDANGQLAFTRSNDTATRVASNGLIEKVRTNLLLRSNTFSTTWLLSNSTMTSGQAGYDGTTNAWLYQSTSTFVRATQNYSLTGVSSFSVYAKAGTSSFLFIEQLGTTAQAWFNLSTGALGSTTGSVISSSITSVGGGWYRCVMSSTQSAGGELRIRMSDSNLSSVTTAASNIYIQDAQLEAGDIATDYIATTTAARSVGPVANIPRIDYLGGGCGKLLLEPQRTNLITFSEQMDNAAWTKSNVTITANSIASPDGYTNADLITTSSTGDLVQQSFTLTSGTSYTGSFFLKAGTGTSIAILYSGAAFSAAQTVSFDLTTKQGTATSGTPTFTITDFGNGWLRCTITATATSTNTGNFRVASLSLDAVSTFYAWGAQLEAGAYATSYIPTLAASVTRGADACSKTGISSLIGQTEGTLFLDINVPSITSAGTYASHTLNDGTSSNQIEFTYYPTGRIQAVAIVGGSVNVNINLTSYGLTAGNHKIAFAYKLNDYVLYVDGAQAGADTSASVPATSVFNLYAGSGSTQVYKQALLFKTRLPNSELASLTTL